MNEVASAGRVILASICVGVFVAALIGSALRPTPRLASRVRPYAIVARIRLGRGAELVSVPSPDGAQPGGTLARLFGPPVASLARILGSVVDARSDELIALKLRQAGYRDVTPEEYRIRHLAGASVGAGAGGAAGILLGAPAGLMLVLALLGFVVGATRWRARLDKAVEERKQRIRTELYTINQLLAIQIKTGGGPVQAVRRTAERGSGVVVEELTEALRLIAGGLSPSEAFLRLSRGTPEYHAARTYEILAAGAERGADLGTALLEFSEDIRDARREDLRRSATRRRAAMLVPTIAILAPVMLLFVVAPIPWIIFRAL